MRKHGAEAGRGGGGSEVREDRQTRRDGGFSREISGAAPVEKERWRRGARRAGSNSPRSLRSLTCKEGGRGIADPPMGVPIRCFLPKESGACGPTDYGTTTQKGREGSNGDSVLLIFFRANLRFTFLYGFSAPSLAQDFVHPERELPLLIPNKQSSLFICSCS